MVSEEGSLYTIFYWEVNNIFTTEDDEIIYSIFTFITPLDLYLFRHGNENIFTMRSSPNDLIEIITVPEQSYFEEYPKPIVISRALLNSL